MKPPTDTDAIRRRYSYTDIDLTDDEALCCEQCDSLRARTLPSGTFACPECGWVRPR